MGNSSVTENSLPKSPKEREMSFVWRPHCVHQKMSIIFIAGPMINSRIFTNSSSALHLQLFICTIAIGYSLKQFHAVFIFVWCFVWCLASSSRIHLDKLHIICLWHEIKLIAVINSKRKQHRIKFFDNNVVHTADLSTFMHFCFRISYWWSLLDRWDRNSGCKRLALDERRRGLSSYY